MLDIGFSELLLVFIVGLLVLGPERLPVVVRNVSLWVGRLRRSFTAIRDEIEREIGADEIKRQIHNESIMSSLKDARDSVTGDLESTRQQLKSLEYDVHDIVRGEADPDSDAFGDHSADDSHPENDKPA